LTPIIPYDTGFCRRGWFPSGGFHPGKDETMLKELKFLSGTRAVLCGPESYDIIRHHHPDGGGRREVIKTGLSLAEAQDHCKDPATSYKIGPTTDWWFDGYIESKSETKFLRVW